MLLKQSRLLAANFNSSHPFYGRFMNAAGGEPKGKALVAAYESKVGRKMTGAETITMTTALEGNADAKGNAAAIIMFDLVKASASTSLKHTAQVSKPPIAVAKPAPPKKSPREIAFELICQYEELKSDDERHAFWSEKQNALSDSEAGIGGLALICMAAGKEISSRARAGLHFELYRELPNPHQPKLY